MNDFSMHCAAKEDDIERVKHLIEHGASVDSRDGDDRTPLHWAAYCGGREVVELLISSKCDLDPKDRDGRTPVLCAAYVEKKDVVDLLLQSGAQFNYADEHEKCTLLHRASRHGWADVVQYILESGAADVNAATWCLETPLMCAAEWGREDVAALLLRAGADVHRSDTRKRTALHCASDSGRTKVVQLLLEEETLDLNPQSGLEETPLHEACFGGHPEFVKQLLIAGADTVIRNWRNETALSVGIRREKLTPEEIRLLVQHGAFLEDCDYARISQNRVLKEHVLKDVDLCTQSIVNKFHRQSLPALKGNPHFSEKLPCIEKFKLNARQMHDVEDFVRCDIQANVFCNIVRARPIVLSALCVQSLLSYLTGVNR